MIACHTNGTWDFVFPLVSESDKALYSLLLALHVSGSTAERFVGNDSCDVHGSVESLYYIIS